MDQPIVPEQEIVTNVLEVNNHVISAVADNQNLTRYSDAVQYLEVLAKNLKWIGDHCDMNGQKGVVSVALYTQQWMKTQKELPIRPLSPESKEALVTGAIKKDDIPVFFLDGLDEPKEKQNLPKVSKEKKRSKKKLNKKHKKGRTEREHKILIAGN